MKLDSGSRFPSGSIKVSSAPLFSALKQSMKGDFRADIHVRLSFQVWPENDDLSLVFYLHTAFLLSWSHLIITIIHLILGCSFITLLPVTPPPLWAYFSPVISPSSSAFQSSPLFWFLSFCVIFPTSSLITVLLEKCIRQSVHPSPCFPLFLLFPPSLCWYSHSLLSIYPFIAPLRVVCQWKTLSHVKITHEAHLQAVRTGVYIDVYIYMKYSMSHLWN